MLALEDLRLGYGPVEVIDGISLEVGAGEVVCILGGNGSGKSTILKAIAGFLEPRAGEVRYDGRVVNGVPAHRRYHDGLVYIPQDRKLFGRKTVYENLELGCLSRGEPRAEVRGRIEEMLEHFPVLRRKSRLKALTLSGGEQQTLALARALMGAPRLILLDEPSAGLSPVWIEQLFEVMQRVIEELALTVIIVEQNIHVGLDFAERGLVIQNGTIALEESSAALRGSEDLIRSYLGG